MFLSLQTVIVQTFLLCRVREVIFEKRRETLLFIPKHFIAQAVRGISFNLIQHQWIMPRVYSNKDENGNFHFYKCVTACSYFVASTEASEENEVPLRKWHCLTIGSLLFLGT